MTLSDPYPVLSCVWYDAPHEHRREAYNVMTFLQCPYRGQMGSVYTDYDKYEVRIPESLRRLDDGTRP